MQDKYKYCRSNQEVRTFVEGAPYASWRLYSLCNEIARNILQQDRGIKNIILSTERRG
jgi:hypothetical protein